VIEPGPFSLADARERHWQECQEAALLILGDLETSGYRRLKAPRICSVRTELPGGCIFTLLRGSQIGCETFECVLKSVPVRFVDGGSVYGFL